MDVVEIYNLICWIALAVAAALLIGSVPVYMRAGAKRSDPSFAAALFTVALTLSSLAPLALSGEWRGLAAIDSRKLLLLADCGALLAGSLLCLFTALTGADVTRVFPLMNLRASVLLVLSYFLLGGRLSILRLCCVMLILLGTVFMESRSERGVSLRWIPHTALSLLMLCGAALLYQMYLADVPESSALTLCAAEASVLLWIFTLARGKQKTVRGMGVKAWIMFLLAAVSLSLAIICTTLYSRIGDYSWLSPIQGLSLIAMVVFSRIFLKEKPPGSAVFGMILVLIGTFAIRMGW